MDINMEIEIRRIFGKREMLWNIQRQIYASKQKGKNIDEKLIIKILNYLKQLQQVEEDVWELEKYIESDIEMDIIRDSKTLVL